MSEGKIIEVFNKGLSEVIGTIKELSNQIKEQESMLDKLTKENQKLNKRLDTLEKQKSKNSKNICYGNLESIAEIGILPNYENIAVYDFWKFKSIESINFI